MVDLKVPTVIKCECNEFYIAFELNGVKFETSIPYDNYWNINEGIEIHNGDIVELIIEILQRKVG